MGKNVTGKTKSLISDERWEDPGLIKDGAAHPFRLTFWGEGNGPVTQSTWHGNDDSKSSR